MKLTIETDRENDGRWIAKVPELPGVLAYGATQEEAMAKALALRVLAASSGPPQDEADSAPLAIQSALWMFLNPPPHAIFTPSRSGVPAGTMDWVRPRAAQEVPGTKPGNPAS
jgi:hypothetical protein